LLPFLFIYFVSISINTWNFILISLILNVGPLFADP